MAAIQGRFGLLEVQKIAGLFGECVLKTFTTFAKATGRRSLRVDWLIFGVINVLS